MSLVWKLLRRHVSVPQFAGFFFANLLGMLIVLLSVQFYYDVLPVFTQGDQFHQERLSDCLQADQYGQYLQWPEQYVFCGGHR